MGEEEKKPEEKKMEEKKPEGVEEKKEEVKESDKPAEEKREELKNEEAKDGKESKEEPPPPPQEILLKVFMHCEGCARKVRRSLKGFEGVEDVITDCKTQMVVVKGEKADPLKVLERVQRKSHRQVELLSPIPKPPPAEEEKKPQEEKPKPEEKKEEPPVTVVVLKVFMHCEACAQEIKKRIMRMKGVESAEPDLKGSEVSVRGVFDPENLVKYVYKRTGKHAVVVKQEVEKKEKAEESKESKEDKKEEEGDDKDKKTGEGVGGDGDNKEAAADGEAKPETGATQETKLVELKHEFLYPYYPSQIGYYSYPEPIIHPQPQQYFHHGYYNYAHVPQMFSDENPNACSVM